MQNPPPGYSRVSPYLLYEDAEAAIGYLSESFGFEVRHRQTGGAGRLHAELLLGEDGLVMLGQAGETFSSCAAPPHHLRRRALSTVADWFVSTSTTFADTTFNVSQSKTGKELFVERFVATQSGVTDTVVDVTSGFSFSIDAKKLDTASASG